MYAELDERNAQVYADYEAWIDAEDAARDDSHPGPEAVCSRCGDVGVEWNVEVQDARGAWVTVCTDCERPEDWIGE